MRILIKILFFFFFFIATFIIFFYLQFPGEVIARRAERYVEEKSRFRIDIGDASLRPIVGAIFRDVKVFIKGRTDKPFLELEKMRVAISPFSLMDEYKRFHYDGILLGGAVKGWIKKGKDTFETVFSFDSLQMERFPVDSDSIKLSVKGEVTMKGDLNLNLEKIRDSSGKVAFDIGPITIPENSSSIYGFTLPATRLEKISGKGNMDKGALEITPIVIESELISGEVSGKIYVGRDIERFRFNLKTKFKIKGELGNSLSLFLSADAKGKDDYYYYIISGNFKNPRMRPDRMAVKKMGRDRERDRVKKRKREEGGVEIKKEEEEGTGPKPRHPKIHALSKEEREKRREEMKRRREERRKRREERRKRREERERALKGGVEEEVKIISPAYEMEREEREEIGASAEEDVEREEVEEFLPFEGEEEMGPPPPVRQPMGEPGQEEPPPFILDEGEDEE